MRFHNKTRGYQHILWAALFFHGPVTCEDHVFLYQTPLIRSELAEMERGEEIEVSIQLWKEATVKKCGIHVLFDEPNRPNAMEEYGCVVQYLYSDTAKDDAGHGEKVSEDH